MRQSPFNDLQLFVLLLLCSRNKNADKIVVVVFKATQNTAQNFFRHPESTASWTSFSSPRDHPFTAALISIQLPSLAGEPLSAKHHRIYKTLQPYREHICIPTFHIQIITTHVWHTERQKAAGL